MISGDNGCVLDFGGVAVVHFKIYITQYQFYVARCTFVLFKLCLRVLKNYKYRSDLKLDPHIDRKSNMKELSTRQYKAIQLVLFQ